MKILLNYLFLILIIPEISAQFQFLHSRCGNTTFTPNTTYQSNVNTVLKSFSTNNFLNYGYYNFSSGKFPDRVNGMALCRGDIPVGACRLCVQSSASALSTVCPNQKQAFGCSDNCIIFYSYNTIFHNITVRPRWALWNDLDVSNISVFNSTLIKLMSGLQKQASLGNSDLKFATGKTRLTSNQTLYGMVECSPDMSTSQCTQCVQNISSLVPQYFITSNFTAAGARVITPSCNFRYEMYSFYGNVSDTSTSSAPSPRLTTPSGTDKTVKRLSKKGAQGEIQFKNEILILAKLQHRNLVRLLGFCLENEEMILVYEFVVNSSLDHYIFDPVQRASMQWETRYNIINGTSRGLLYLHEDSSLRIIHSDLKAGNVLLDAVYNPKLADFGMARLFNTDQTDVAVASKIVGTGGYMAPEYVLHGHVSVKCDVFSFGVLVLEIISGQKISCFRMGEDQDNLPTFAWKNWTEGKAWKLVDPTLSGASSTEILRCIHIALLCVQHNVTDRPTMSSVYLMLSNESISLKAPSQPAFFSRRNPKYNTVSHGSTSDQLDIL